MKKLMLLVLLLDALARGGYSHAGDWSADIGSSSYIDDNVYKNYSALSDVFSSVYGSVARDFFSGAGNLRIHYNGSGAFYGKYTDRNYFGHNLGAVWTRSSGDGGTVLNLGGNGFIADYQNIFDIFDSRSVQVFVNLRQKISAVSLITAGLTTEITRYPGLEEFDNREYEMFSRWQVFFPTRTTFNAGLSYAYKSSLEAEPGSMADIIGNPGETDGSKIKGELLIAQSITDLTGINFSYGYSYPLKAYGQYIETTTGAVLTESDLFNDPFSYEIQTINSQFTKIFSKEITLSLMVVYLKRIFITSRFTMPSMKS